MEGQRIQKAKQSLILFLKSLPENSLFNVISFGSQPKRMFEKSQVYNQKSLNEAISQVNSMDADLGGTDIFSALKNGIYNDKDSKSHLETYNAFLLTDGEDSPEQILNLVQNQTKSNFRIYTLGIGDGCSQYLLKNIAEIGNGKCQFVADNEDINVKVIDLLEDSMTQYLEGFKLELPEINISQIIPDPESITAIKKNEELVIQILFPTPIQDSLDFQIKCFDPQKQKQISYKFELKINESQQQDYFHKLAAHKLINYYEYSLQNRINQVNKIKVNQVTFNNEDIINLSIQNQILSKNTAYICQICHLEDEFKQLIKEKIFYQNQTFHVQQLRKGSDYSIQQRIDLNPSFVMNKLDCLDIQCCIDIEECYEQEQCCMDLMLGSIQQNMCMDREDLDSYEQMSCKSPPSDEDDQPQKLMQFEQMQKRSSLNNIIIPNSQETAVEINYIDLLQCVQADGSFILNKKFGDSIKLSSLNNDNHYEEILWTTIIALFYLELHCISDKASWQLIYQKAILLLKKNGLDYFKIKTEYYNNYQKLFEVSN